MRFIRQIFLVAIIALLGGCNSSTGYDPKACNEIAEKIANDQTLTQADYATMIEQIGYMDDEFQRLDAEVGDDVESWQKLLSDDKVSNMMGYTTVFTTVLSFTDELDADNAQAWDRMQQRFEERDR